MMHAAACIRTPTCRLARTIALETIAVFSARSRVLRSSYASAATIANAITTGNEALARAPKLDPVPLVAQLLSDTVTRQISSTVVTPSMILLMPDMRRVLMPSAIISCFSSADDAPCKTISLRRSVMGMTS
jgi:hypothetical protein